MHDKDSEIILGKFKKPNKDVLVKHLFDAFQGIVYCKRVTSKGLSDSFMRG